MEETRLKVIMERKKKQTVRASRMEVPAQGLLLVRNSEDVIVSAFHEKMGVITCQGRCGTCMHSVVVIQPIVILYIDEMQPRVVCAPCAEKATSSGKLSARIDIKMSLEHRKVWTHRHGFAPSAKCHICEQCITIHGGWEACHDIPAAKEANNNWAIKFTGHPACNFIQDLDILDDCRRIKYALSPVDRTSALLVSAASTLVTDALRYALDHRNPEKRVRARLALLVRPKETY